MVVVVLVVVVVVGVVIVALPLAEPAALSTCQGPSKLWMPSPVAVCRWVAGWYRCSGWPASSTWKNPAMPDAELALDPGRLAELFGGRDGQGWPEAEAAVALGALRMRFAVAGERLEREPARVDGDVLGGCHARL